MQQGSRTVWEAAGLKAEACTSAGSSALTASAVANLGRVDGAYGCSLSPSGSASPTSWAKPKALSRALRSRNHPMSRKPNAFEAHAQSLKFALPNDEVDDRRGENLLGKLDSMLSKFDRLASDQVTPVPEPVPAQSEALPEDGDACSSNNRIDDTSFTSAGQCTSGGDDVVDDSFNSGAAAPSDGEPSFTCRNDGVRQSIGSAQGCPPPGRAGTETVSTSVAIVESNTPLPRVNNPNGFWGMFSDHGNIFSA